MKKLSSHKQDIWQSAFNAAYDAFDPKKHNAKDAESYAFAVANAAVKKKRTKASENMQDIQIFAPFKEAEFIEADGKTKANFVIIDAGRSKNDNVYSAKNLTELEKLINESKTLMFFDHKGDRRNRSILDWAATTEAAQTSGSSLKGTVDFTQKGQWLYEEVKKHPDLVGVSINAKGYSTKVKQGQDTVNRIDEIVALESIDFVTAPAAGGRAVSILAGWEAENLEEMDYEDVDEDTPLADCAQMHKDKRNDQLAYDDLVSSFLHIAYKIMGGKYDADEKKKHMKKLIKQLMDGMDEIDFDAAYSMYASESELNKVIFDKVQKFSEGDEMKVDEIKTAEDLKANYPQLFEAVAAQVKKDIDTLGVAAKNQELATAVEGLNKALAEKDEVLAEKDKALIEFEKKVAEAAEKIKSFEGAEKKNAALKMVENLDLDDKVKGEIAEAIMNLEPTQAKAIVAGYPQKGVKPPEEGDKNRKATVDPKNFWDYAKK